MNGRFFCLRPTYRSLMFTNFQANRLLVLLKPMQNAGTVLAIDYRLRHNWHLFFEGLGTNKNQSTLYPRWFSQFIVWRLPNHLTCKLCNFNTSQREIQAWLLYVTYPNFMHFKGLWSLKITRQLWFPSKNGSHFMIPEIVSNMFLGEILVVSGNLNFSSPKKFPSKTTPRGHWSHRGPWKLRFSEISEISEIFFAITSGWRIRQNSLLTYTCIVLLRLILPQKL